MIWSLTLAAVGVFGLYISGKKNYWGWAIGLAAQVLWIAYAVVTQQWGFIISALAYGWVYGKNFLSWRKDAAVTGPAQDARAAAWDEGVAAVWIFLSSQDPRRERPSNPYRAMAERGGQ